MVQKTLLNDTPENLIHQYSLVLQQAGINVEKIILFGSYATGQNKPWSDLDLCIISKQFGKHPLQESMELAALAVQVDSMIEPHPMTLENLNDKYDPLANEIKKYGIEV